MVAPAERQPRNSASSRTTTPKRILIADDDAATRSMLVELLKGEGYDTLQAKSGSEVLRIVPVEEPDLLLIDLRMPDQDGIQILKRLAAQEINVGNVILMTAYGTSSTTIEAMHLGMPVVALATTEVPGAVPPEAGVVSTRVDVLRGALRALVDDPEQARAMGKAARAFALEHYGLARFLADWDALLTDVVR